MKIIAFLSLIYVLILAAVAVNKIQKKNNYKRCKSVVSAAVATGRLPRTTNIHNTCKHYLE